MSCSCVRLGLGSLMLLVTVSRSAVTRDDFEAASISRCWLLLWLPDLDLSTFLLFGQFKPQLIALRRLASPRRPDVSFDGFGDDETISCARTGLTAPLGVVIISGPFNEYRSHNSKVGSAWGDLRAVFSLSTLTAGKLPLSVAGDDVGDELRARFLPFRGIIGDKAAAYRVSCWLFHSSLSFGEISTSFSAGRAFGSGRSLQFRRVTGVMAFPATVAPVLGTPLVLVGVPLASPNADVVESSLEGLYWNLLSFVFVTSDTGGKGLGL